MILLFSGNSDLEENVKEVSEDLYREDILTNTSDEPNKLISCPGCQKKLRISNLPLHSKLCHKKEMKQNSNLKEFVSNGMFCVNKTVEFNNSYSFNSEILTFSLEMKFHKDKQNKLLILNHADIYPMNLDIHILFIFPNFKVRTKSIQKHKFNYLIIPERCMDFDFVDFQVTMVQS